MKVEEGHNLNSDHSPVYPTISNTIIEKPQLPYLSNKYPGWSYFRYLLTSSIKELHPKK